MLRSGTAIVMTTGAERKALNEGTFRDANEKLERGAREILQGDEDSPVPFLCECPRQDCTQVVFLTLAQYEEVRAGARRGLSVVGHDDPSVERVVEEGDGYVITEKFGEAGDVHADHDPRREDQQARRVGENQALYRQVNERLEELNDSFGSVSGVFSILCECGELDCAEQLEVPREAYEATRRYEARFIVKPGHEIDEVEHLLERHDGYAVVEKDPGPARRVAEETDTRS
jgi:hypothetical protein